MNENQLEQFITLTTLHAGVASSEQLKKYRLLKNEFETLTILNNGLENTRDIHVTNIADLTGMPMSGVSRLLKHMEEKDLITRAADPADRRNTIVILSQQGKIMFNKMLSEAKKFFLKMLADFTEEEKQLYIDLTLRACKKTIEIENSAAEGKLLW